MTDRVQVKLTDPVVGRVYVDDVAGRLLEVVEVRPGDRLGREVIGLVSHLPRNGHAPRDYATDLRIFASIWRPAP